jgi:glycosyltransferase involved in cell wall biosynthesis
MEISGNTDPLVSICIPVYNAETTIGRTLDSVIGQTYTNIEIIVVDNLSTDGTMERVRERQDSRIRIVENPVHFPCAEYNWNTCFAHARGEFIALFHADDVYSADLVARQVDIFRKFPSVAGVFTQADVIDENDKVIDTFRLPPVIAGNIPYTYQEILPGLLEYDNFLPCPSAMVRGDIYKKLAPFRYEQFGSASDLDMWLRVAGTGPIIIINENLLKYRMSRTQWSFNLRTTTLERDFFRVLDFHIAENGTQADVPEDAHARYELRRMEDQIFCALNFLRKRDFSGCRQHVNHMTWRKYIRIILMKPRISYPVLTRGFFKFLKYVPAGFCPGNETSV